LTIGGVINVISDLNFMNIEKYMSVLEQMNWAQDRPQGDALVNAMAIL
jgi:hypothetical protein